MQVCFFFVLLLDYTEQKMQQYARRGCKVPLAAGKGKQALFPSSLLITYQFQTLLHLEVHTKQRMYRMQKKISFGIRVERHLTERTMLTLGIGIFNGLVL